MNTITITLPTIDQVEFKIIVEPETEPVQTFFSGNAEVDMKANQEIQNALDNGNIWAWCSVGIKATWKGFENIEWLGSCSYESEQDFINHSGYYSEMKEQSYIDLIKQIKELAD